MAEVDDPGKLLFSFDIHDCSKNEYLSMGRAVQMRNSKKLSIYSFGAAIICIGLSVAISFFILIIALAIVIEAAVYFEYSSRNIANKIKAKGLIHYVFYEDGLTEEVDGNESTLIWYNEIRELKVNKNLFTLVCKNSVVIVPRNLIDENAECLLIKLKGLVVASHSKRRKNK